MKANNKVVTVTITKDLGSAPRGVGSMMIVGSEGRIAGSVGGGAIEHRAIQDAILADTSYSKSYLLSELDMTCGGDVELFFQVYPAKDPVLIIGAGHICQSLVPILTGLDYSVTVLDYRENIFNEANLSCTTINAPILEGLATIDFNKDMSVVIVTHGHEFDEISLEYVLERQHRYVGMIGSSSKIKACYDNLMSRGIKKDVLSKVYAPIGLNLGGETPEAIALSIASQIQCIKYQKDPVHYKTLKEII